MTSCGGRGFHGALHAGGLEPVVRQAAHGILERSGALHPCCAASRLSWRSSALRARKAVMLQGTHVIYRTLDHC